MWSLKMAASTGIFLCKKVNLSVPEKPIYMTWFHQLIHHFFEKTNTGNQGRFSLFLLAKPQA